MTVYRDLHDIGACHAVVGVQEAVWGRDAEIVPASLLVASAKRGGILLGAYEGDRLVGFVWSMPAVRDSVATQWSHMLAVRPEARGHGIGQALKRLQRDRALAVGVEIVEWTFDPLQATNAHLNITNLGCISTTYLEDAYGRMSGPLHRGTPTDRLIAEWRLGSPHVERRLARATGTGPIVRSAEVADARLALGRRAAGAESAPPATPRLDLEVRRVLVAIPPQFTALQQRQPAVALAWRLATRAVFTTYFARGYRVVDFEFERERGGGRYVLAAGPPTDAPRA